MQHAFRGFRACIATFYKVTVASYCAQHPCCCFPPSQSAAHHAGVAYWEYDYLNGATDSDNLVRMSDSTWTNILQPAAAAVVQKVAALPVVNDCTPGQLVSYCVTWCKLCPQLIYARSAHLV